MGALPDRLGQPADTILDPGKHPAWERLGSRVATVGLLGPVMASVRWGNS